MDKKGCAQKKRGRRKLSEPARKLRKSDVESESPIEPKEENKSPLRSTEQTSSLKSVRTKRTETTSSVDVEENVDVETSDDDSKVPPKKRKFLGKNDKSKKMKSKKRINNLFTESEESESSHEEWYDLDEKPRKKEKKCKPTSWECEPCEMRFDDARLWKRHRANHHWTRTYACPTCGKLFKWSSNLKTHINNNHTETPKIYTCSLCDFTTKSTCTLRDHFTRKHTEDYKYECDICGKNYKSERDYKVHMTNHEDGPQICDFCGISYPSKVSLHSHITYKHRIKTKPFKCTICNQRLVTEKNLEAHMLQHSQSYVCELCGMKFGRKGRLSQHRKIHAEKSFPCTVCGRTFANMTTQRVHMVTHSAVKPYACDVCGSSYTQRSSLMLHWRKKHPEATEPPPPVTLLNITAFLKTNLTENCNDSNIDT